MTKSIDNLIKYIIIISLSLVFFFGKRFALIDIPLVPGFILDFILVAIFLMSSVFGIRILSKERNYFEIGFLFYFIMVLIIYSVLSTSTNINEIGQDALMLIYPVLIYLIYKNLNSKFTFSPYFIKLFLIIYSIYLIFDFTFERSPIVKKFLGINLVNINVPWVNMAYLKPSEATFFLSVLIFLDIKSKNDKFSFLYLLPGIYFGLNMTDSRTILYSSIIFFILLLIENRNRELIKRIIFLIVGIVLSFSFLITEDGETINRQVAKSDTDVGMRRVRVISAECFVENAIIQRDKDDCEKRQSGFKTVNVGYFIQSKSQGFSTPTMEVLIDKFYEIGNTYGSVGIFSDLISECYLQTGEISDSCDKEDIDLYLEFLNLRNKAYDELCGDNISWRIRLWEKSIINENSNLLNFMFGHGVGFSIPEKLINENHLPIECYQESLEGERPLRNSHNTFITFFYRFGLINLLILSFILTKSLISLIKTKSSSIIIFGFAITFLDPILDSPISLFPFCLMLFYLLDKDKSVV